MKTVLVVVVASVLVTVVYSADEVKMAAAIMIAAMTIAAATLEYVCGDWLVMAVRLRYDWMSERFNPTV